MNDILSRLNPPQQRAVRHKNGPLLILAGAGSGKTTTMASRISYLIAHHHIAGNNILGLSFTRKAAEELKERVAKQVRKISGSKALKGLTVTTFHSLAVRMLRQFAPAIGYSQEFTILDESDQREVITAILKHIKIDDRRFDIDVIRAEISLAKNRFLNPDQARDYFLEKGKIPEDYAIATASVYEHYQARLKTLNAFDFDDLLYRAIELLETSEEASNHFNARFRYILVDEYQDTNPAQFRLLENLTKSSHNICVVGDDDQSIYAWRGAEASHILEFQNHFPGAEIITLDQNYRSTKAILDAANEVIAKNTKRYPKKLWSDQGDGEPIKEVIVEEDRAEAEMVAEEILHLKSDPNLNYRFWDFAILFRSNAQSRLFEEALRMRKMPYKIVGGMSFLERKEIRDSLAYLKLLHNPNDDASFRRVVNYPARGLGKTSLDYLNTEALNSGESLMQVAKRVQTLPAIQAKARDTLERFANWFESEREKYSQMPFDLAAHCDYFKNFYAEIGLKQAILDDNENPVQAQKKWENVEELVNAFGQLELEEEVEKTSLSALTEFLSLMMLDPDQKDDDKDQIKDEITLLSLHGSKGLEYPVVFMVGMEEGLLPHRRTIEEGAEFDEERRLAYVGITRAKRKLYLTRCANRMRYGKKVPRLPSRFTEDIPLTLKIIQNESEELLPLADEKAREEHETKVKDFLSQIRANISKPAGKP